MVYSIKFTFANSTIILFIFHLKELAVIGVDDAVMSFLGPIMFIAKLY